MYPVSDALEVNRHPVYGHQAPHVRGHRLI